MALNRRTAAIAMGLVLVGAIRAQGSEVDRVPPMVLEAGDSWFRLIVAGYQFPNNNDDEWDSNWLIIDGSVRLDGKEWRFRDPCITTFEAIELVDWLEACARGNPAEPYCALTEPNLQFDLVDARTIRVSFALESAPPWAKQEDDWTKHGFNLPVGPNLVKAAKELRSQLDRFPVRGGWFERRAGKPVVKSS